MPVRAILFDLDGTLRHSVPSGYDTFVDILSDLGYTLDDEQRREGERWTHFYWSIAPELIKDIDELGADTSAFWARYAQRQIEVLRVGDCPAELAEKVNALMTERYRPVDTVPDDVRPTLLELRARGIKMALVSNRTEVLAPVADALGLLDLFDLTLSAGEAGSWKPAPGIFLHALNQLGVEPADAVYVGDNFHADVEGARNAGLTPILVDPRRLYSDPRCLTIGTIAGLPTALGLSEAAVR